MKMHLPRFPRLVLLACVLTLAPACEDVRVTAVDVVSLRISPAEATVTEGDTVRLQAIPEDQSGNALPGRPINWTSEDPEVVAVDGDGLVHGLSAGTARIRATSGQATGHASVTVLHPPSLVLSESEVDFEAMPGSGPTDARTVNITNGGEGMLDRIQVAISHPSGEATGWLTANLAGTTTPTSMSVRADPAGLPEGKHRGQVAVAASAAVNSPQLVEVTLHVGQRLPRVGVGTGAVGFSMTEGGNVPLPETVSITNSGGGALTNLEATISYQDGQPTGWLEARLAATTAPTDLTLTVDPSNLDPPAVLDAVVEVSSPDAAGSPGRIQVRFRLGETSPVIDLDPREIGWEIVANDPSPAAREVAISNEGGGTLGDLSASVDYDHGGPTGWLEIGLSSTEAPSVLTAELTDTGLSAGEHGATIRVSSPDAAISPQSVSVRVQVGQSASAANSTIKASPTAIPADGEATSTVTVQLRDADGNELPRGGDEVVLSTSAGSVGNVSDNGDGTYMATLTASTTAGVATITGTVNGDAIDDEATVEFTATTIPPSASTSTIGASPGSIVADGKSTATITVRLRDAEGNDMASGGDGVTLSTTAGSLGAVTDNDDGTYSATLTSSTSEETATITGTVNGAAIDDEATVEFTARSPSPATSTIHASPTSIVADGESTATITVQLRDTEGEDLASGGDNVTLSTSAGSLGDVTDNDDGTYTATLTSSTTAQTAAITGTVNGAEIDDEATVAFTRRASTASPATSTIEASPTSLVANGSSKATITVRLRDAEGNQLTRGGDAVTLSTTAGSLEAVTDNDDGTYTARITSSSSPATARITGTVNGAAIDDDATVDFRPRGPPSST
jgi:adhesin/invasin